MQPEALVDLLRTLEQRSRSEAAGLPIYLDLTEYWEGVTFSVAGVRLAVSLKEVVEILNQVPTMSRVPGAKSWVRGVANIRGNLLPILDLQGFLGGRPIVIGRRSRVLMIHQEGMSAGLLVSSVMGLRHFNLENELHRSKVVAAVKPYIDTAFLYEDVEWPVFSMKRLASDPAFQVTAK